MATWLQHQGLEGSVHVELGTPLRETEYMLKIYTQKEGSRARNANTAIAQLAVGAVAVDPDKPAPKEFDPFLWVRHACLNVTRTDSPALCAGCGCGLTRTDSPALCAGCGCGARFDVVAAARQAGDRQTAECALCIRSTTVVNCRVCRCHSLTSCAFASATTKSSLE